MYNHQGICVEKLLAEHQPKPLPEEVKAKLRKIVERAEK